MIEAHRRHLLPAELARGKQPAVAGYDISVVINQDRNIEAKGLDAVSDLPDLLLAVTARIGRIRLELVDPSIDDFERPRPPDHHRLSPVVLCRFHPPLLRCAIDTQRWVGTPRSFEFRKTRKS